MEEFTKLWPIIGLALSLAFNIYQSSKTRENNRSDKETDAINKLNQEMHTVTNSLTEIKKQLSECEKQVSDVGVLKERIDNTKQSLTDIKAQMGAVQGMVQTMLRTFKPDIN